MSLDLLVAVLVAGAVGYGLLHTRSYLQETQALRASLWRIASVINEAARIQQRQERLGALQETTEAVIEGSTAVIRAVHQGIADIPLGILESIPATRDAAKVVRDVHDMTTGVVYGSISVLNKTLGRGLRKGLEQGVKHVAEKSAPPSSDKK